MLLPEIDCKQELGKEGSKLGSVAANRGPVLGGADENLFT
jgi:hypothetical protein